MRPVIPLINGEMPTAEDLMALRAGLNAKETAR